jgi:hypothetical protein
MIAAIMSCAGALCAGDLRVDYNVKYETEHINRGRPEMKKTLASDIELGFYPVDSCFLHVGADAVLGLESHGTSRSRSDVAPHVGISYEIIDNVVIDAGYIHHFYVFEDAKIESVDGVAPGLPIALVDSKDFIGQEKKKQSSEIYIGIATDFMLSPSIYCFYDFTKREVAVEGAVSFTFDLSERVLQGLSLKVLGNIGFDKAKKPYAIKYKLSDFISDDKNFHDQGYFYYGIGSDLVFSLNDKAKFSAGVSYEGNTASKNDVCNVYTAGARKGALVFRGAIGCSF